MVHDLSQDTAPSTNNSAGAGPRQAVAGLMPPQVAEARIREVWPSVVAYMPGLCNLAARLMKMVYLAPITWPVGWLILGFVFGRKLSPFICRRYTLTNRRLMIQHGLRPSPVQDVALAEIDDVRLVPETLNAFYRAGDLEVLSKGQVRMRLAGVREPESFRQSILNAVKAWVPEKAKGPWLAANAPVKA
jgi:hypothetical protein